MCAVSHGVLTNRREAAVHSVGLTVQIGQEEIWPSSRNEKNESGKSMKKYTKSNEIRKWGVEK